MMTIMMKVMMKVAHSGRSALSREHFSFFISLSFYNSYRNYGFRNISVACCGEKGHSQSIKLRGRQQQEETGEERREAGGGWTIGISRIWCPAARTLSQFVTLLPGLGAVSFVSRRSIPC